MRFLSVVDAIKAWKTIYSLTQFLSLSRRTHDHLAFLGIVATRLKYDSDSDSALAAEM
jgi:hypothetical protein